MPGSVLKGIKKKASSLKNAIRGRYQGIKKKASSIKNAIRGRYQGIKKKASSIKNAIRGRYQGIKKKASSIKNAIRGRYQGIKKKASSIKNAIRGRRYATKDAESDTWALSSDGSTISYTIQGSSGRGNIQFQERSLSEDELNRQAGKRRNATRRLSLGDEQFDDHEENLRKCWSEDKIVKPTKKKRVMSQVKSVLGVIPELEHAHDTNFSCSEHQRKTHHQAIDSRASLSEATIHGDNTAWSVHSADYLLDNDAKNEDDEVFEERPDGDIDWVATGARPKDFKDQGTSSGISSLRPKLPKGNEGPMMEEFMNSALENSPRGCSASTPFLNQSLKAKGDEIKIESTDNDTRIRQSKSTTNITASGNVLVNFSEGVPSDVATSPSAILAVNPSPSQRQDAIDKLQDKTSVMLKTFERQLKVSPRHLFPRAFDVLSYSVDSRVVILVGNNGDGKTVCGKYMLLRLATNFTYALLIRSVKEWELIEITGNSKPNTIVFFDNFLGSNHLSATSYTEWEPIFDEIFSACTDGNMSAIIAMGKSVFEEYTSHQKRHPLFADRFILDLTNEYKLNKDEKIYMIKQTLKGFRYAKDVVFCSEREDDNTSEFYDNGILSIWEGTVVDIANLVYPVGFPKALEIFASSIENIRQGADFFLNPTLDMFHSMNDTRRNREHEWFALGNLVLSEGSIKLVTYDPKQIGLNTFGQKLFKKQIKKSLKQLLCSMMSDGADSVAYLRRGIEGIRGYFIEIEDGIARFNCTSTYYSAAICFGKYYPRKVVDIMPQDFIQRCIGPARAYSDKHRLHLELDQASYKSLTKRLLNEIENKNVKEAMNHTYWGERPFVTSFLQYVDKEAKMKILLQTLDKNTGKTIVCYGMQRSYTKCQDINNFTEQVLKTGVWKKHMKKKPQLKSAQEKICLQIAAVQRNVSSFQAIIERMAAIDDKCFETVIKSGSVALLNIVFKYQTYRIDICRALEKTAFYHYKNDPATAVKMANNLLSKKQEILIKSYMKKSLSIAIENNDIELLDMLKALGADLNSKFNEKEILHLACLQGRNECVKLLLESGVDTGFRTASGGTALHIVIANGYYNIAYLLLQHSPTLLEIRDNKLQQPLHTAAMAKNIPPDLVENMIDMGADINARDKEKKTPLHIAISAKNLEVVELLTKNNACLKLRDIDGQSPIILAFNENVFNDVEAIFIRNGKLYFYDTELLFKALELNEKYLVKFLLQIMDVNVKNMKGNTLLHAAIELKLFPMVSLLVQSDEIDLELESNGVLPVHQAVIQGDIGIFKLIAEKANNRSTHSATGSTILHIAAKLGRLDIVKSIISETPSLLAVKNAKSETPLVKAVQQGHDKVVEVLAEYTATQTNEEERIPMTKENLKALKTLVTRS